MTDAPLAAEAHGQLSPVPGLERVAQIEAHNLRAWPASVIETAPDGWVYRATPGLAGRGRSNNALTPARVLDPAEYDGAIRRVRSFAAAHGIATGMQVSPLPTHVGFLNELAVRGWQVQDSVVVMTGDVPAVGAGADPDFGLVVSDHATPDWLAAWADCDRRADIEDHARTVFPLMAGVARFVYAPGNRAVGISVELDGIVGLFCIAVSPDHRRQGLGKKIVQSILAQHHGPLVYLQVFSENAAGIGLYESLGFGEEYRYCHCVLSES